MLLFFPNPSVQIIIKDSKRGTSGRSVASGLKCDYDQEYKMKYRKKDALEILSKNPENIFHFEAGFPTDNVNRENLIELYKTILRESTPMNISRIRRRIVRLRNKSMKFWYHHYLKQFAIAVINSDKRHTAIYLDLWNRLRVAKGEKWLKPAGPVLQLIDETGEPQPDLSRKEKVADYHLKLFDELAREIVCKNNSLKK